MIAAHLRHSRSTRMAIGTTSVRNAATRAALAWLGLAALAPAGALAPLPAAVAQTDPTPAPPEPAAPLPEAARPTEAGAASEPAVAGDRAAAYRVFREHFDARRFAEALPAAQQVVDLTEQRHGADALELVVPLVNFGTTKHRLSDHNGAAVQYQRALKIVEASEGAFSRSIVPPLLGLGVTYAAVGDHAASAQALRRAVDVSRKLDGLFNVSQLVLVEALISSYVALNQIEDADREQQYALRLAEKAYGKDDPRLIPALERSAGWLEDTGYHVAARQTYARALEIVRKSGVSKDLRMVPQLRGIARMYRMEYLHGAEPADTKKSAGGGQGTGSVYSAGATPSVGTGSAALSNAGEEALQLALEVLDAHPREGAGLRGATLVDLGDWYMVAGKTRDALRRYKEAWAALTAPGGGGTAVLDAPAALIYRPPSSARRNPTVAAEEYTEHVVEVEFTVTAEGRAKNVTAVASDVAQSTTKAVTAAIKRSRYRPRFVDGAPVVTPGVRHRQTVYVRS